MEEYIIVSDSGCDLSAEMVEEMGIVYVPLTVYLDDKPYKNYLDGREIGFHEFYEQLKVAKTAKTSAVNQQEFIDVMEPLLKEGHNLLCLGFDSGISGTYNAGAAAVEELKEKYPERKLIAVDTLCASMGQGLILRYCWEQKQAGKTMEEVAQYCEDLKQNICHWFTVDDLMFLKRGGRVSAATAVVGTILNIKPIMHVDEVGHLIKVGTARGNKAALRALCDKVINSGVAPEDQRCYISHADNLTDANYLADMLREQAHVTDITINYIGPVIGCHTGPGLVALFFKGDKR
ncbi:MAG: DegV family protein [Clostridia bacterium]|nr:DegV family protein [Clostridia bacterium]